MQATTDAMMSCGERLRDKSQEYLLSGKIVKLLNIVHRTYWWIQLNICKIIKYSVSPGDTVNNFELPVLYV